MVVSRSQLDLHPSRRSKPEIGLDSLMSKCGFGILSFSLPQLICGN